MDLGGWHTLTWGLDGEVHDVALLHKMYKNEEWTKHKRRAEGLAHVIQTLMGMAEEELFAMQHLEHQEELKLKRLIKKTTEMI